MANLRAVLVFGLAFVTVARAEEPKPRPFKNVQFLKQSTHDELDLSMNFISGALGVGCDYCHVTVATGRWPMDKDDKMAKRTARKMMVMAAQINHDFFGGVKVVTCVTCHQGHAEPPETLSLETVWQEHRAEPGEAKPATVTVNEVLEHYAQAAGGKAAWDKLRSRVAKGKLLLGPKTEVALEVTLLAPDKYRASVVTPNGTDQQAYDGKSGWRKGSFGLFDLSPFDLADSARDAQLQTPIKLDTIFSALKVLPDALVGSAPAHVLEGQAFGCHERLYFDAKSGLLVRRVVRMPTPLGDLAEQIDYEDWKTVDGVMVPFTLKRNSAGQVQMEKYSSIQHNLPVDEKLFVRPAK